MEVHKFIKHDIALIDHDYGTGLGEMSDSQLLLLANSCNGVPMNNSNNYGASMLVICHSSVCVKFNTLT